MTLLIETLPEGATATAAGKDAVNIPLDFDMSTPVTVDIQKLKPGELIRYRIEGGAVFFPKKQKSRTEPNVYEFRCGTESRRRETFKLMESGGVKTVFIQSECEC